MTGGVFVSEQPPAAPAQVTSKATMLLLPLLMNSILPSGLNTSPSGPESGFTPLARAAQHCAPGNQPNSPLAPKPMGLKALQVMVAPGTSLRQP